MTLRSRTRRDAVAAVEAAIVLPFLVIVIVGIWETSYLLRVKTSVSNAAREAARAAATGTKTFAEVKEVALTYLRNAGIGDTGVTIKVENLDLQQQYEDDINNDGSSDISEGDAGSETNPTNATQLHDFRVTVVVPFGNVPWSLYGRTRTTDTIGASVRWSSLKDLPIAVGLSGDDIPQVPVPSN